MITFETPIDFDRFVEDDYDASVDAGILEGDEHTTAEVEFAVGRSFFVRSKTGWHVDAIASGTKYWQDANLS